MSESKKTVPMARTWASAAFLREVEPGTFLLFRSIEVETRDPVTGVEGREKLRDMCVSPVPLRRFERGVDDERAIKLRTVHPETGEVLELVEAEVK